MANTESPEPNAHIAQQKNIYRKTCTPFGLESSLKFDRLRM
jgi:hypothetical protein